MAKKKKKKKKKKKEKAMHRTWLHNVLFTLLALVMLALCARLFLLIRTQRHRGVEITRTQQRMVVPLPGRPGNIYARCRERYILMASSKQIPTCFADPQMIGQQNFADVAIQAGRALGMDPWELQRMLSTRAGRRFVRIKRDLTPDQVKAVKALRIRGLGIVPEWRREYPNAELAATVIGFRYRDGNSGGGMELAQKKTLAAIDGQRTLLADAARRPIWNGQLNSRPPEDGDQIFVCLDAVIQGYLQKAVAASLEKFAAKWGTGVVVDPHSGEILAMCSMPTFDPNRFNQVTAERRTNRAITVPYEPGSVVKPLFAAQAVEAGLVSYASKIFCENGSYRASRGGRITDHGHAYQWLSLENIVVKSSNIGMAKIGEMFGNQRLHAAALKMGFGAQTGIDLPGESSGIVRSLRKWDGYSTRRVPFGQEISATAIQLAMAFSVISNGGLLLRPRLIEYITDVDGRVVWRGRRRVVRRVLSPQVAARTRAVMREVVERGTGKNCKMKRWSSFGKTGTAQIAANGVYADGAYVSTFVGGAPVDRPEVLCIISIYWPKKAKGYYGSTVAAPGVKDVLQQTMVYLRVPPDRGDDLALRR